MKIRPCREPGCPFPAAPRRQRCGWHFLDRATPAQQQSAAAARLALTPVEARRARVPKEQWPAGGRWCAGCQSMVPDFYASGSRCKACASRARHGAAVAKTYGITAERYDELLALQIGRCAICRSRPVSKRLAVDHDHHSGVVRGLLCKRCNHDLLGAAHDDVALLEAAITYLEAPPASGAWQPPGAGRRPQAVVDDEPPF